MLVSMWMGGCCLPSKRNEPSYPTNSLGWKEYKDNSELIRGSFVLKKNEMTTNGHIQIKVLDIVQADPCAESGTYNSRPKVLLEFTRASDQALLCKHTYAEGEGRNLSADCGETLVEYGLLGISVRAINFNVGWVFFVLHG